MSEIEKHMLREIAKFEHNLEKKESNLNHELKNQTTRYNSYEMNFIICVIKTRVFTN